MNGSWYGQQSVWGDKNRHAQTSPKHAQADFGFLGAEEKPVVSY